MVFVNSFEFDCCNQIYQPKEVEKVKVVSNKDETNNTKEFEAAANRLAKTRLVSSLNLKL